MNSTPSNSNHDKESYKLPKIFETKTVFEDTINRIYFLLTEQNNIRFITSRTSLTSLFALRSSLTYSIREMLSLEHNKKLCWEISSKDHDLTLNCLFNLLKNTLDNTTLLVFEMSVSKINAQIYLSSKTQAQSVTKGLKNICVEIIEAIELLLKSNNENIFEFESIIIHAPIETVWNFITKKEGLAHEVAHIEKTEGNSETPGCVFYISMNDNMNESFRCKVMKVEKGVNKLKWKYSIRPLEGIFQKQEIEFVFINVGNNNTFLSISHEFKEKIESDVMLDLESRVKMVLYHIKTVIEKQFNHNCE